MSVVARSQSASRAQPIFTAHDPLLI